MRIISFLIAWQSTQGFIGDQRPHWAKLFISKNVDTFFFFLYVFSSKICFLTQPEFLAKVQEPFGEVLLWILDPFHLELGEEDLR